MHNTDYHSLGVGSVLCAKELIFLEYSLFVETIFYEYSLRFFFLLYKKYI
jgi:hypothetical protein